MLYAVPDLSRRGRDVLARIDLMREELRHQVRQTPTRWTASLRRTLTAQAIAGSNTIEGYKVDHLDVEDLLDGEREVATSPETSRRRCPICTP